MAQAPKAKITIPEPEFRPGDEPDYSDVKVPEAGAVTLPPLDVEPRLLRNHAFSVIRILRRDGEAVGPWATMLSDEELVSGLKQMMTLRVLDARMVAAQRQGKTSFYVPQLGEEAVTIAFQRALGEGDMNFPTYRTAGLLIAQDYPLETMMNQIFSNEQDPLGGRQMPVLYSAKDYGFFTVSGNLGTQFVQAVGWAMAAAIDGSDRIAAGWIGGGDAKLAAAAALWLGLSFTAEYMIVAAMFGGSLTIAIIRLRAGWLPALALRQQWLVRLHDPRSGVPYGLALSAAALVAPQ